MQDGDDRQAARPTEPIQGGEQGDLVSEVEMLGGLVKEQKARLLGQGHRDQHPLALAAGQLLDPAADEVQRVGVQQRPLDGRAVLIAGPEPGAGMRRTAHLDQLLDAEPVGQGGQLGQDGHLPGKLAARDARRPGGRSPRRGRCSAAASRSPPAGAWSCRCRWARAG